MEMLFGAGVFFLLLGIGLKLRRKADPVPAPVEAPGIASYAKWKASLDLYTEGKLTLDDFVAAWSGWTIERPKKMSKYEAKMLDILSNPPLISSTGLSGLEMRYPPASTLPLACDLCGLASYLCDCTGGPQVATDIEPAQDYGWHPYGNGKFGPYPNPQKDYGALNLAKRKLGP